MQFTKGSIIFFSGDRDERIFILQSGCVILSSIKLSTGGTVAEQVHVGEFFGVKSSLAHMPRYETAQVLTDTQVVALTVQEFEQIFSSKQEVIWKMLRVFSKSLRELHKQTEIVIQKDDVHEINPDEGMFKVARGFYDADDFHSCADVLKKILIFYPDTAYKSDIARLLPDAQANESRASAKGDSDYSSAGIPSGALCQFSLPMFDRFSKSYKKGDVIITEYEPGETFYLVQTGEVQVVKCINNSIKNIDILKPGEFFGEMAILDKSPRSATCMAAGHVKCLEFNKENFELLITGNPQTALVLLKLFCKRIYDQKRRFRILCIKDLQARLADVFLMLDEMNPVSNVMEKTRRFNVTLSDIAHWSGLSQEVTRDEINKLVEKRKIEVFDTYIVVSNIVDMRRMYETRSGNSNR
jgi:CRP-like cAMP-binding protein